MSDSRTCSGRRDADFPDKSGIPENLPVTERGRVERQGPIQPGRHWLISVRIWLRARLVSSCNCSS